MIEEVVINYLQEKLDVPSFAELPEEKTLPCIVVEKTGGGRRNLLDDATLAIQSYHNSLYEAAQLNELVKNAMYEIVELPQVSGCRLNSDYNYTDREMKMYRYQAVFDIYFY